MKLDSLLQFIREQCIIFPSEKTKIVSARGQESGWLFDLRPLLLRTETLALIVEEFWDRFENLYPFQICSRELTAVPLLGAIIAEGKRRGKPVSGIIIRKSRKKTGLQKLIEGNITTDPVVFVDDLVNSGESFQRQIMALEASAPHLRTLGFFTVIRYRDATWYRFFKNTMHFESLFTIEDFGLSLQRPVEYVPNSQLFDLVWKFESPEPNHFYIVPKSGPVIDSERIYFGSDAGFFWAINQKDGSPVWKFKVGKTVNGKEIFSTAALYRDTVYFGAYDGNFYALDSKTGSLRWRANDAEWIGSSPAVGMNLDLVFIGLEYGLINKRGGVAAYDLADGTCKWHVRFSREYIHASPAYSSKFGVVGIGSNDKRFYCLDVKTGHIKWVFETNGEIKGRAAFDERRGNVLFGSADGFLYAVEVATGILRGKFQTENLVYATPVLCGNSVLIASEDKHLYRVNLDNGKLLWKFRSEGRILSSPLVVEDKVYIGSNDGRFYELEEATGKTTGFFQSIERITNQAAYNEKTCTFFVLTAANELLALRKKKEGGND